MADNENSSGGKSCLGLLLIAVAALIAYLWWTGKLPPGGDAEPDLTRPMVATVTGLDQGDPSKEYPIQVHINQDAAGVIAMNYRGKQYSRRFGYATRSATPEQVSLTFQAQLPGTDQIGVGENYFLTLNQGGGALLSWHNRRAEGRWKFAD